MHLTVKNCGINDIFIYYFWLQGVVIAESGLSLVAASGGCSLGAVPWLLIKAASLVVKHRL